MVKGSVKNDIEIIINEKAVGRINQYQVVQLMTAYTEQLDLARRAGALIVTDSDLNYIQFGKGL